MNSQETHLQVFRPGRWQWLFALGLSVMLLITIATLIQRFDRAEASLNSKDVAAAAEEMKGFQTDWLEVEGIILLREGMAALLAVVALLAFLNKSGNGDKSRWIWIGAGVGILASWENNFLLARLDSSHGEQTIALDRISLN